MTATQTKLIEATLASDPRAYRGALVEIATIRGQLGNPADFDASILALAKACVISLHRHDYPASLTVEQKESGFTFAGDYFLSFAIRQ